MKKLVSCQLGDLIEFQRGYDLPRSEFIEGEYPVQSSNGILGYHNEYKVEAPGITIGRSGTVGIPHLLRKNFFPHNTALFVKDFKGNDVEYIYYLLKYLDLGNRKSGSGVPTMNRNHLHPLKIKAYRDFIEQQKIANILSTLDRKISLNQQINQKLESMAKQLYDYWFVQFDFPDENGKPYKSSGGEMVWCEVLKREVPKRWESIELGKFVSIKKGVLITEKTANLKGNIKVVSAGVSFSYFHDQSNYDSFTITVSASGANAGFVNFWREEIWACDCTAIRGDSLASTIITLEFLKSIQEYIYQQARGSAQPHVYPKDLETLVMINPADSILDKFQNIVEPINNKIAVYGQETQKLTQLRDFLLPMLMNGQIFVE
ncbi:restriction endonuclease [Rodentibacter mrazii]|uniref:Restriction endonuclease n=1 Tax=Rodentibacter mrazii TaxID=1908257 RepID=A0A1V3IDU9_9PAST|nr:restriction endonuclease subunit S [Rodentibacter mrazii]OOF38771.1 restriction endonuclease [Rodentibacter mrazii]